MANGKTQKAYYGYTPPKPFDWVTASEKALGQVEGVIEVRVKERADNEKTRRETSKTLERLEQGQNKEFNELVADGSFVSKDYMYDLTQKLYNNEINSKEYRMATNNLQDGWNNFSDISKGFNEKLQLFADREQEGISSIVEGGNVKNFSLVANFENKKIEIGPNGKVYWAMLDENGKVIPGRTQSMTALNTTPQQLHDKVNVSERVGEYTALIGTFKEAIRAGKVQDTTGVVAMEDFEGLNGYSEYENMVMNIQGQILGGPGGMDNAASVLGDNSLGGNNQTYFTYQEDEVEVVNGNRVFKATSEHAGKPIELGIKLVKNPNGVLTSELTDEQMEIAKDIIENTARQQIGLEQKSIPFFQSKAGDAKYALAKKSAATNYHASVGASTLNDLSKIEGQSPTAERVIKNVRWDGGNLVYDIYNPKKDETSRRKTLKLEGLGDDAKAFQVFGLITGLTGTKLKEEYELAKKSLKGSQKDEVDTWLGTPGSGGFVTADFTPLKNMSKISLRTNKEEIGSVEVDSVPLGEASPMEHLSALSARVKSGKSINSAYKKDFVKFVKQITRTGGGGEIEGLTVSSPTKTGGVVTMEVSTAAGGPYTITISGDPSASVTSIEKQLQKIIEDDYSMRDL